MKSFSNLIIFILCLIPVTGCQEKKSTTIDEEWVQLFNGKDLNGWMVKIKGYALNSNAFNTFRVEEGVLKVSYDEYEDFGSSYGHIFYEKPFSSYRLKLQYRFAGEQAPGGQGWAAKNSGVMIHSQSPESMALDQEFPVSIEVQLLGGLNPGEERPTANLCTPGTHVIMNDILITEHCINSTSKTFYDEQWIDLELLVIRDSIISHFVNGVKVISYSRPEIGGEYNTLSEREGEIVKDGYISLQSESHPIEFRKIELMELDP